MKSILRAFVVGAAVGSVLIALWSQAERRRLQMALTDAEKRLSESAVLPPDMDARIERGKKLLARSRWEDDAIGRLPGSWKHVGDDDE